MRNYTFAILVLCLMSCGTKSRITYYCYNDVCFSKVNNSSGETYFYYGKIKDEKTLPNSGIKCEYYGFNNGMHAYFVFNLDSTISIRSVMGKFELFGNSDINFKIDKMKNIEFIYWHDSILGNYNNTVFISNISEFEINHNNENNSSVSIYE